MGEYKPKEYYDEIYAVSEKYKCSYTDSPYYDLWLRCLGFIPNQINILEVGCGTGQFAEMLDFNRTINYKGFDFSEQAIATCHCPDCFVGDATDGTTYKCMSYELIICMEVLEHLADDVSVIRLWPKGVEVLITVPCFDDPSHVRWFNSEEEIRSRYEIEYDCLRIDTLEKFDRWYIIKGITK